MVFKPRLRLKEFPNHSRYISPTAATTTTSAPGVTLNAPPLPLHPAVAAPLNMGAAAAEPTGHAHRLADKANAVAAHGLGADAEGALEAGGHAEPEAGQQGGQGAAGDERHDDQHEDLDGVPLGVVDEVAQEALDLLDGAGHEGGPGRALVVRGTA